MKAARYRGQLMAAHIRRHGLLSRDAPAKMNQELAYFEDDAKDAYLHEVKPALAQNVPIEMPETYSRRVPKVPQIELMWRPTTPGRSRTKRSTQAIANCMSVKSTSELSNRSTAAA